MEITLEELKEDIEYSGCIYVMGTNTGEVAKIVGVDEYNNKVYMTEHGEYKEITIEELNDNFEESGTYECLMKEFKDGQGNLCPHEPLAALCMIVETPDYNRDYEAVFTVPISWLISKLDEREGKRYWDEDKLFTWLNEEYDSEDSEWVWEEAYIEKKLITFNIF